MVDAPSSTVYGVPIRSARSRKLILKKIEAVFPPFKLDDVRDVLVENNVHEFVVTEIKAHEAERAPAERWGRQNLTDLAPRLKLEMAISDRNAAAIAYAILRAARTRRPEETNVTISSAGAARGNRYGRARDRHASVGGRAACMIRFIAGSELSAWRWPCGLRGDGTLPLYPSAGL